MPRVHRAGVGAALAAVLFLLVAAGLLAPSTASAHALPTRSDPVADARLLDAARVTAVFTEPLNAELSFIEVLDGHGERVDEGPTHFSLENDREMSVGLRPGLVPGYYVVVWQTLSDLDGHLLRGSFPFTILAPDGSEPAGPRFTGIGESGGTPTAGPVAVKWVVYLAAFALVGGMFYGLIVTPATGGGAGGARRPVYLTVGLSAAALLAAGAAELFVQAAQIGGLSRVGDALDTVWGARWWQRELAAGVAGTAIVGAYALRRMGRDAWARGAEVLVLAAGLGCLFLLAAISHGASVDGSFWAVAADFIHLAAAAVWAGMLVQLVLVIRWSGRLPDGERAALAAAHLGRFSAAAAAAVLVLLATGVFSAFVEVDSLRGLVDTGYGVTLVAKLALLAPLLAVAAINATVVGPAALAAAGRAGAEAALALRRLGRLAAVEVAIIAAVVAVAAVLVQFPTARQEAESAAFTEAGAEAVVGYEETRPAGDLSVNVSIAPNAVGTNSFQVFVFPPPGEDLSDILRVRLRFKPPDPSLGPSQVIAEREAPNFFRAVGAFFTQPGDWEVEADLRRRGEDDVSAFFAVPVAGAVGASTDSMALPLTAGSWAAVAASGVLLVGLVLWLGVSRWPGLPESARGSLRVAQSAAVTLGVGLVVLAAVGLLDFGERPIGENPVEATVGSIAAGRAVYFRECALCHGDDGRGDGPAASGLSIPPSDFRIHIPFHSDRFFFLVMSNGFGSAMPAFADRVSEEDRWNVLNYLQSRYGIEAQGADGDG